MKKANKIGISEKSNFINGTIGTTTNDKNIKRYEIAAKHAATIQRFIAKVHSS